MATTAPEAPAVEQEAVETEIPWNPGEDGDTIVEKRRLPWDGAGILERELMTMDELWAASPALASDVKLVPINTDGGIPVPRHYAALREYDQKPLGIVGERYRIVQNKELTQVGQDIIDSSGAVIENALGLYGGAQFVVVFRIPEEFKVGGIDETYHRYLTLGNAHDGSAPVRMFTGIVRSVCRNTFALAIGKAANMYTLRHTQSIHGRIEEVRTALKLSLKYQEDFEKLGEDMLAQKVTKRDWDKFLDSLVPKPPEGASKRATTMANNRRDGLTNTYFGSDDLTDIRGTKWGALQAVIEYSDHEVGSRETATSTSDESRFTRIWTPAATALPNKALQLLTA